MQLVFPVYGIINDVQMFQVRLYFFLFFFYHWKLRIIASFNKLEYIPWNFCMDKLKKSEKKTNGDRINN